MTTDIKDPGSSVENTQILLVVSLVTPPDIGPHPIGPVGKGSRSLFTPFDGAKHRP